MKVSRASRILGLVLGGTLLASQGAYATGHDDQSNADSTPCTAKLISAHEGYQEHADADTVKAQEAAFRIGANIADSDLWVTKDGFLVEMHANDVSITTNGHGLVTDMTLDQFLALRTKHFDLPVPTFDDSLAIPQAHLPGRYLMFETKYAFGNRSYLDTLANQVEAAGMASHVIIYSAFPGQLAYLKQIDPNITVWYKAGSIPPLQEVEGFDGVMLDAEQMNAQNVAEFHAAGLTVIRQRAGESPSKWQAFLASGADGLMTDHATELIKWCRALG
jgi:glycerophosphoryl diester phosphodiesterase